MEVRDFQCDRCSDIIDRGVEACNTSLSLLICGGTLSKMDGASNLMSPSHLCPTCNVDFKNFMKGKSNV